MNRWARWLILACVTGVVLALTAALIVAASIPVTPASIEQQPLQPVVPLEPALAKVLADAAPHQRLNIIVEMQEQVAPTTLASSPATNASARRHIVSVMQSTADRTQAGVRAFLSARWLAGDVERVTPFWIFNGLAVKGALPSVVHDLAARPDIGLIRLDHWRRWIDEELGARGMELGIRDLPVEWGVERIRADKVWNALGVSGTGVVVANLDTGVDWQHPALQPSYRGYSPKGFHRHQDNWYDATGEGAVYPVDGHGHGSHTMGTMVGQGGIGVAPGARWIAVRAFDSEGFALDSWIHAGFEWLLAPNGDPGLAPQVVNNSWGNSRGTLETFQRDVDALRASGIFALFSAGNAGPERETIGSPASLPGAFAVGASDRDDEVASFSGRGPSPWGEVRPYVVAPGVNVYSTLPGGTYGEKQGTSMATPHAAGTVALMLSAWPDLTITQTAFILTSTAAPLSETIPNNDSGYGRIDAYAAVALAADAGLISGTVYAGGERLSEATIRATPAVTGLGGLATSDIKGRYQLFLGAGYYDLAASAFGYATAHSHALSVTTGEVTEQDFDLAPLPVGHLQGTVRADDGRAVEATVSVLGTPVTATATGGSYRVDLPSGRYTLEARALGHRVVTASVTVTAGQTVDHDFVLPESMRVLLVDGGSWYYGSQVTYYRQALNGLAYTFDESKLKHLPDDIPTLTDLLSYDLVIWSAPDDSPGLVGAEELMTDYLGSGGNLLLSGQDVAFWDGGGTLSSRRYYADFMHSVFRADNAPTRQVICRDDSAFSGVTLTIEGTGGADNQRWPDEIEVRHPDFASLVCHYEAGQGAVIQTGLCEAHRALNLGFGFEGIGDATDRADFMARALDWFASPRLSAGVELLRQTDPIQIAPPGEAVTHTFRLRNLGEAGTGDLIDIEIDGDEWPSTVLAFTNDLAPCTTTHVRLRVVIPAGVTWNASDAVTLTARSSVAPALSQTLVVTSKAPAPVLLVDDDRWFDQEQAYEDTLKSAQVPYDRWEVSGIYGDGSPPAEVLTWYPIVLWFTGYDWFDPIHPSEADRLVSYLDDGGRFFLSSQDAIWRIWPSELADKYLGVISYSVVLSHTAIQGVPAHVLGDGLGPVDLAYPFNNWSDSVLPAPGSQVAFRGQHGQPAAVTREGACTLSSAACRWRSAFFAFPIEALPEEARRTLLSRLVGWLSWLGRSDLESDRAVAQVGDVVGYTLALRNDGPHTVFSAAVSNTLPGGTTLVSAPDGGASYDAQNRRITWTGDVAPGADLTFTYQLSLPDAVAGGLVRNIAEFTLGEQGFGFQRQAIVRIAVPDLSASSLTMTPPSARSSTQLSVKLVVRNDGLADAPAVRLDNPLPWPLRLITGTLFSDGIGTATELPWENRIQWEGEVAVGAPVTLTYLAIAPLVLEDAMWMYNATHLQDGLGGLWERGDWLHVEPHRFYLPISAKNG